MRRFLLTCFISLFIHEGALAAERPRHEKSASHNDVKQVAALGKKHHRRHRRKKPRYVPHFRVFMEGGYVGYSASSAEDDTSTTSSTTPKEEPQTMAWHGALVTQGLIAFTPKFAAVGGIGGSLFYLTSSKSTENTSTMGWYVQPEIGLEFALNKVFAMQLVTGYDFGLAGDMTIQTASATTSVPIDSSSRFRVQPRLFLNLGKHFHLLVTGFGAWGDMAVAIPTTGTSSTQTVKASFFLWNAGAGMGMQF